MYQYFQIRGLYQVQTLYEFVKEGYVNSLGSVGSDGTDTGMNNSSGLPKCGKYTSSYNQDKFTNPQWPDMTQGEAIGL